MAGASMNDIKTRIKSVTGTMQITKALELVATSKLRRAKERVERIRPFYETLGEAIDTIESSTEARKSVFTSGNDGEKTLFIVIAGDRGLAGGYNANVFKLCEAVAAGTDPVYLPVGKKAIEYYKHRDKEIYLDTLEYVEDVTIDDTFLIAEDLCRDFKDGVFKNVIVVYTRFASMLSQIPVYEQLLPLERDAKEGVSDPIFGGDPEEILDRIVPDYVGGVLTCAVYESLASESGARRTSMNAANKNASEMIDTLMLKYNRARQAVITQEITEIVSGAEAL